MRILYATDGSEGAIAAGDFLHGLTLNKETRIHIVTVMDAKDRDTLLQSARAKLEGLMVSLTTEAISGHSTAAVVEAILAASDVMEADFILIGAPGHSPLTQFFSGSVALEVARHARRSVLIARPSGGTRQEFGTVIAGVDSSARCRDAVLWTASVFPLPPTCAFRLVGVVPSATWTKFLVPSSDDPANSELAHEIIQVQTVEEEKNRAESIMESLAHEVQGALLSGDAVRPVTTEVRQGTPADELIHTAEESGAPLIVVSAHGRTALDRFLIGSISEGVLRHAPCSVLIVKTPAHRN